MKVYQTENRARENLAKHKAQVKNEADQVKTDLGIDISSVFLVGRADKDWSYDEYIVILTNRQTTKNMLLSYKMGVGHREQARDCLDRVITVGRREPEPFSILSSIRLDDPKGSSFECWAQDYGYDPDSRKALDIYLTCQKQTDEFRRVFPKVNLDEYKPIEDY